jgi:tetraacyldisaccharide-1-P 4'-kinase
LISEKLRLLVITTEKDYVKVPKKFKNKILPIPLIIQFDQEAFYNLFIQKVKKDVNPSI